MALPVPSEGTEGVCVGVEEELGIKVPGLPVPVIGRLDMLVETPKALVVIDAKTSKGTFTAEKLAQATAQLALYGSALDPLSRQFGNPRARSPTGATASPGWEVQ